MNRIDKLTPEQEARMHTFAQERIKKYLDCISTPETEKEAWEAIKKAYVVAGLEGPKKIIWFDSYDEFSRVRVSVGDSVRDSVWALFGADVMSFYGFFNEIEENDLHSLDTFLLNVSGAYLTQDTVYAMRKAHAIRLDEDGRLHSENAMSYEDRSGWGFYSWHGVTVPEYVIMSPQEITKDKILKEDNLEVRRAMIERIGQDKFIEMMGTEVIDRNGDYELHEIKVNDIDGKIQKYLKMKDTSTERIYFLRIPPEMKTCAESVAWSFSMNEDDYQPIKES